MLWWKILLMINLEHREKILILFDKYKNFLTQTQKQAIQLYHIEDLTLSEVANIVATTRSAIHDAIKKGEKKLFNIEKKLTD
ncbi:MAG: hypothetical protein GY679_00510 [Mycoplasma sp.]|nr:hypothetical protein [Mycoplasma sp.]